MLNEVRARHIKKLILERVKPGSSIAKIVDFEIARREDTIWGLEAQREREEDEVIYLKSLDAEELRKEKEKENG